MMVVLVVAAQFAAPPSIGIAPTWLKLSITAEARNVPLKLQP
jgi:hypothetical protein